MNKKIPLILHIIVGLLFILAIWPSLYVSNDGYKGATIANTVKKEMPLEIESTVTPTKIVEPVEKNTVAQEANLENDNVHEDESATFYSVVDGNKLDANSYAGFKLYRNWCARCHGTYGQGMVGPNLADSLKFITEKEFFTTVEKGKSGTIGSMPSWNKNVKVMAGRDQLYAYLMARSDGAIGQVKPKKQ